MDAALEPAVQRQLERIARQTQAEARVPALQVAIHRGDREPWTFQIGQSGTARDLDAATVFRIGSITKTFTAVMVMQGRDAGLLDLDDPLGKYLDVPAFADATIRRLLSHTAGVQREPHGDIWAPGGIAPDARRLIAELAQAEQVLPPARRFHYSNLGYALLGQLVAKVHDTPWLEVASDRVFNPLGLSSLSGQPGPEAAVGYQVDAYSDHARPERQLDLGGAGAAAQLWGTATDLARWAAFLADPATVDPQALVLSSSTVEEMRWPLTVTNESRWAAGFGLGLMIQPQGDWIVHVGHDGAMPGFLANAQGRRGPGMPAALGVSTLGSSGTADQIIALAHKLLAAAVELDPADIAPWTPGDPAPQQYQSVLGRWWAEGFEHIFEWRDNALTARMVVAPAQMPPAVFAETGETDVLRTISGREVGERLRIIRDSSGRAVEMRWSTYSYTRDQQTFEGIAVSLP
jgi:CubicO group peptidase (beta-lactamase class C family)